MNKLSHLTLWLFEMNTQVRKRTSEEHVNEEVHERQHDGYNIKKEFMLLNIPNIFKKWTTTIKMTSNS